MRTLFVAAFATGCLSISPSALAQAAPAGDKPVVEPGQVLTFYGVRKLEQDPKVSDAEKVEQWEAFIRRTGEQVDYAKKAVDFWKNAARQRVVEVASKVDADPSAEPRQKIAAWKQLVELYPKSREAVRANKRIEHWTAAETKRLLDAATQTEKEGTKVDRIQAWDLVREWVGKGPESKIAIKRIAELQAQLLKEAENVDEISRVDAETKIDVWRDVLQGRPSPGEKSRAERRIAELEALLAKGD